MKFIKLRDRSKGKDLLHVWVEDDCPEELTRDIFLTLDNYTGMLKGSQCTVTARNYELVNPKVPDIDQGGIR